MVKAKWRACEELMSVLQSHPQHGQAGWDVKGHLARGTSAVGLLPTVELQLLTSWHHPGEFAGLQSAIATQPVGPAPLGAYEMA